MPISLRFPIALVLSIVCLAMPTWADFQAGLEAYNRGDYMTALREFRPLADQGAIVQGLLASKADVNVKANNGLTALSTAKTNQIAQLLKEAGAK